jgi:pyrroline-5-carboxylate reductase
VSGFPGALLLIGAGKMGGALLGAWLMGGADKKSITVLEKIPVQPYETVQSLEDVNAAPECVVLAVKPQSLDDLLPRLHEKFGGKPLYISIAAGKTLDYFRRHLGDAPVIRAMPNTPALIGKGITALCANARTGEGHKATAATLLHAAGEMIWLDDETLMNAVTAISGSGPAYVFLFLEALIAAGKSQGLPEPLARRLAIATFAGSAGLAETSRDSLAKLRTDVTSPGGTTEAALHVLMKDDCLKSLIANAVENAVKRAGELAE